MYLGSKIFSGTVVFGKRIKLFNGNRGIFFGKSKNFITKLYTKNIKIIFFYLFL